MKRIMSVVAAILCSCGVYGIIEAAEISNPATATPPATKQLNTKQRSVEKLRQRNIKARAKSGVGHTKKQIPAATPSADAGRINKLQERNQKAKENAKNLGTGSGTGDSQSVK